MDRSIQNLEQLKKSVLLIKCVSKQIIADLDVQIVNLSILKKNLETLNFEISSSIKIISLIFSDLYKQLGSKFINDLLKSIVLDLNHNSIAFKKEALKTIKNKINQKSKLIRAT